MLTAERLRSLMVYDEQTGEFEWLVTRGKARRGSLAGSIDARGYRVIRVDGRFYKAHRLVWFYMTGEWPKDQIDHINGVRDDNRFCNLREATHAQNTHNSKVRRTNKLGHKGVRLHRCGKFEARIRAGKVIHLGLFENLEDAVAAYQAAAAEKHGNFARSF